MNKNFFLKIGIWTNKKKKKEKMGLKKNSI